MAQGRCDSYSVSKTYVGGCSVGSKGPSRQFFGGHDVTVKQSSTERSDADMSPRSGDTDPSLAKTTPLRLQMPLNDPDIDAFLAAQGSRYQSKAILMLIRMWINEFGPVSVLDRTMDAVTVTGLKQNSLSAQTDASGDTDVPAQTDAATSTSQPEADFETEQTPVTPPQRTSASPAVTPPASDDFESFFRQP